MKPHELKPPPGAHVKRRRAGRGEAAGRGKTAGRGTKGTRARGQVHAFFEGGQMPLIRRIPKLKGFTPPRRKTYGVVNVGDLSGVEGREIGPDELPSRYYRQLWFDTVNSHPPALRCACETFGVDRLLLGTDYPYLVGPRWEPLVRYVEQAGLSPADTAAILGGNAQALLGL